MRIILTVLLSLVGVTPLTMAGQADSHIRSLAASCAACHGYEGKSQGETPSLAGMPPDQFLDRMRHYRDMDDDGSVMNQHAKGLTREEISLLAGYFACVVPDGTACNTYRQKADGQ
ncbi:Cytochrome c553 [Methylobacillus rhizosphaerae]|uniref:Cytochrome c553 n=1 Tax=Methylobacillus rhizosphaerae TaxID=551994 RepID=A0A238ZAR1_9PROT|nr:c-type cytochrome [Methylobacillus rhizosphaerae]SNR80380.1 Cytochrome c553 [Methylobacillus rhizosphaerae]